MSPLKDEFDANIGLPLIVILTIWGAVTGGSLPVKEKVGRSPSSSSLSWLRKLFVLARVIACSSNWIVSVIILGYHAFLTVAKLRDEGVCLERVDPCTSYRVPRITDRPLHILVETIGQANCEPADLKAGRYGT